MKITKLEQSAFIIETKKGYKIGIDIGNKTPLSKLDNLELDILLISHIHSDHFCLENIQKIYNNAGIAFIYTSNEVAEIIKEKDINLYKTVEILKDELEVSPLNNIFIKAFQVDHGPNITTTPRENFGFLITVDNETIYFAGDMYYESGIDISELLVDYALIPIGGFYTFDAISAINFIKKFKSVKKVIPMHYDNNVGELKVFDKLNT